MRPLRESIHECRACLSRVGRSLPTTRSLGYTSLSTLVESALQGCAPMVRPSARAAVLEHCIAVSAARGVDLNSAFAEFCDAPDFESAASLCSSDPQDIQCALRDGKPPFEFFAIFAVVAFAVDHLKQMGIDYVGEFSPLLRLSTVDKADPVVAALEEPARAWGLRRATVLGLAAEHLRARRTGAAPLDAGPVGRAMRCATAAAGGCAAY